MTNHIDLLKEAHELLARSAGEALGLAMSGKNHPNPDKVLTGIFERHNEFLNKKLNPALRAEKK
jgi:hypothetical protein